MKTGHEIGTAERRLRYGAKAIGSFTMGAAIAVGANTVITQPDMVQDGFHAFSGNTTGQEAVINAAVKEAMGVDVHFRCASIPEFMHTSDKVVAAYVHPLPLHLGNTSLVRIEKVYCDDALAVAGATTIPRHDQMDAAALAVHVITHEAEHIKRNPRRPDGRTDEATTECFALQESYKVAQALGATEDLSYQLAMTMASRAGEAPEGYQSPAECYNDGALDLYPNSSMPAFFPLPPR